ncbi:MAG: asparaginase [Lachnospiraceae bacterium]|nr:asparaginase [Lachnospiraceae bacterium]
MKILVLFTGGTIGSSTDDGIISLDDGSRSLLIRMYRESAGAAADDVTFMTRIPYTILSEDLSAREINLLLRALEESVKEDFDGIIVTHGTDTQQYAAAACALRFGSFGFYSQNEPPGTCPPIIFVSSERPLGEEGSNGLANFTAAVDFIRARSVSGVGISYRNAVNEPVVLHDPLKTMSHHETAPGLVSHSSFSAAYDPIPDGFEFPEHSGILTVGAYPGQIYQFGDLLPYRAVLLRPYHSATLNTASAAFRAFCADVGNAGLPMFLSGCPVRAMYETTQVYRELGIQVMLYGPFPADYMSLWAKYGY